MSSPKQLEQKAGMSFTAKQRGYIRSVDGQAHMSAVEIIGGLEYECLTLQRENDRLRAENENLREALNDCAEYLDHFADVNLVGDPAEQVGNREMQLLVTVKEAMGE